MSDKYWQVSDLVLEHVLINKSAWGVDVAMSENLQQWLKTVCISL